MNGAIGCGHKSTHVNDDIETRLYENAAGEWDLTMTDTRTGRFMHDSGHGLDMRAFAQRVMRRRLLHERGESS